MSELTFWIIAAAVAWIGYGILHLLAKRDARNYVEWIAEGDWE